MNCDDYLVNINFDSSFIAGDTFTLIDLIRHGFFYAQRKIHNLNLKETDTAKLFHFIVY